MKANIGYVFSEGDNLCYEVRGQGEPLLMIPGAGGDAGFYKIAADLLCQNYQVIIYDRRGNSRSTRNSPQNFEISQQARDAVAVIKATGHQQAHVFGSSGGGIIALELARNFPDSVRTVIIHEPPIIRLLPDAEEWLVRFANWYTMAYTQGSQKAMSSFMETLVLLPSVYYAFPKDLMDRNIENNKFFLHEEMLSTINYMPDVATLIKNNTNIVVAAGEVTLNAKAYYGMTAPILAELLSAEFTVFPGHHLSYIDMPEEWTSRLIEVLK